jgi:hypothetical protein
MRIMVRILLSLTVLLAASAFEARADLPRLGIFRKKKEDAPSTEKDPAARVKQLLDTLKADPDEKKRLEAVAELSEYDPRTHLDMMPALLASLKADPSASVRAVTAEAIGELKPVTQNAGVALEQTLTNDPSESVRKSAQAALWQYHLNGYRSAGASPAQPQTAEPPLAKPKPKPLVATPIATPVKQPAVAATTMANSKTVPTPMPVAKGGVYQQTVEPPLARVKSESPSLVPDAVRPPVPSLTVPPLPVVPTVPGIPLQIPSPSVPPPPG